MSHPKHYLLFPETREFIPDVVHSLVNQTYQNLEILLIDDGSTDDSPLICNLWNNTDSRIQVFHNANHGLSFSRNYGLNQAQGKYVLFVDSDDFLDRRAISQAVTNIEDSDMLVFGTKELTGQQTNFHEFSQKEQVNYDQYWQHYFDDGLDFNYIVSWNKLCRRDLFDDLKFRKNKINEDAFMAEKLIANCQKITLLNENLYYYRRRSGSITTKQVTGKDYDSIQARLERIQAFILKNKLNFASKTLIETKARMLNLHQKVIDHGNETPFYQRRYQRLARIYQRLVTDTQQAKINVI